MTHARVHPPPRRHPRAAPDLSPLRGRRRHPADRPRGSGPATCFNCARPLPGPEVMKLVGELRWLQDYTAMPGADASADFDASLEPDRDA